MKATTVKEIKLNNGTAAYAEGRTVMSETGLPAETKIEYVGRQSRAVGTGYTNSLYRIVGTDDLLTILHKDGPTDNISWDNVKIIKRYFEDQKEYGRKVGKLCDKYYISFEAGLALGDKEENYKAFVEKMKHIDNVCIKTINDLYAGIGTRKSALYQILGKELYESLKIDSMGQKNSKRLAMYVAKRCEAKLS